VALAGLVLAIGALALALRALGFATYARGWDPCEYVWVLEGDYLPHSPYVLYVWLGRLAHLVLPAASALSALSLLGGLALIACAAGLVRAQAQSTLAGFATAAALAVFPGAVRMSGQQEVYALAAPLCVAACYAAQRARFGWSGIWFGAALAMHSASVLVAPAWLLALAWACRKDARAWMRALAGAALVPALAIAWLALEMPAEARARIGLLDYVHGIQPMPESAWHEHVLPGLQHAAWRALERTVGWRPQLALCALLACFALRAPRAVLFWVVYALPYFAYEGLTGLEVDPGVHLMFSAPAIAALLGLGASELTRWLGPRVRREAASPMASPARRAGPSRSGAVVAPALVCASLALVLGPSAHTSFAAASALEPRAAYLTRSPMRELLWVREHAPLDAYIVQPLGTQNPNLAPCYALRRPISLQHGRYWHFIGARGWPLMANAFEPLTVEWTLEQLARGATILGVALPQEPLPPSPEGTHWEAFAPGVHALRPTD
jgi:hypothetical protein